MKIYKIFTKSSNEIEILRYFKNIVAAENFIKEWLEKYDSGVYYSSFDEHFKYRVKKMSQFLTSWEVKSSDLCIIYIEEIEVEEWQANYLKFII